MPALEFTVGTSSTTLTSHPWFSPARDGLELDIAIVGAGISGLYSAFRLAGSTLTADKKLCVFEAAHRIGGRIDSVRVPGSSFVAELGAMRYIPECQPLIKGLVDQLQLRHFDHKFPIHGFFVRGRDLIPRGDKDEGGDTELSERAPQGEVTGPLKTQKQTAYPWLQKGERGLSPFELVALGIARACKDIRVAKEYEQDPEFHNDGMLLKELNKKIADASSNAHRIVHKVFTPVDWRAIQRHGAFGDHALHTLGFFDVIQATLSEDAFKLVEDGLGYQTIIGTWNAAEAIPWFLKDFSFFKYESLREGMSSLPKALVDRFAQLATATHSGATIAPDQLVLRGWILKELSRCVTSDASQPLYRLTFEHHGREEAAHPDWYLADRLVAPRHVYAKHVILALPNSAMKANRIAINDLRVRRPKRQDPAIAHSLSDKDQWDAYLNAVSAHPLLKIFAVFSTPWWMTCTNEGACTADMFNRFIASADASVFSTTRVFTDLPFRMTYYHGPDSESRIDSSRGLARGMIMAYCDSKHAAYWDSLNDLESKRYVSDALRRELFPDRTESEHLGNTLVHYGVNALFAERIKEQLARFHRRYNRDILDKPEMSPELVLFKNWSHPPYYGGWHSWNIADHQLRSSEVRAIMRKPFMDDNIHVVGEAFSCDQGWIEGALRTTEAVLCSCFKLSTPEWIDPSEQLDKSMGYRSFMEYVCE